MQTPSTLAPPQRTGRAIVAHLSKLYLSHRTGIQRAVWLSLLAVQITQVRNAVAEQKDAARRAAEGRAKGKGAAAAAAAGRGKSSNKIKLDRHFARSMLRLLRIVIPGWRSPEARLLVSHSFFLVARTVLSLWVADMDGAIVKSLVKRNGKEFMKRIVWWMVLAVPATFTNAMLSYHQAALSLKYRTRLTQHLHEKYLSQLVFYKMAALDDRIKDPDQIIAFDVANFSNNLAAIYSNLAKPLLDMTIYMFSLTRSTGSEAVVVITLLARLSYTIMRALTPPFGKYVADEARLEGEFRFQHSRLIDYSEEIALYAGHEAEKDTLDKGYFTLIKHVNYILRRRFYHGFMEDYVVKYFWGALGLLFCSIPVFVKLPGQALASMGDRSETFVSTRRKLLSASDAANRLMFSYRDIMELAGHTARVASLLDVMDDIKAGRFDKKLVSSKGTESNEAVLKGRGKVVESRDIKFVDVPIISPNGDVLVEALSFSLKQGDHLLVVGPNGCGKSSLFRILGGLWPVYGGTLYKPPFTDIFYLPQRPYLSTGSLRQQITYPDRVGAAPVAGAAAGAVADNHLLSIMKTLGLEDLVQEHGWDEEKEWKDVLSGGLQQKVAMARLFYHKPRYAILDECTSSVTLEAEKVMYDTAKALGITLMTVSHRRSLWKYHTHILQFDGQGHYVFTRLDAERRLRLEDEKEDLEVRLRQVPEIERRIRELTAE